MKKDTKRQIAQVVYSALELAKANQKGFDPVTIYVNDVILHLEPNFYYEDYINYHLENTTEDVILVKIVNYTAIEINIHTLHCLRVGQLCLNIDQMREND